MPNIPWRKVWRIITYILLVIANILLLIGIVFWYLAETGRVDLQGLEPITVFISAIIGYLLSFLSFLASKDKKQPDQPSTTINIGEESTVDEIIGGNKSVSIQGDNIGGDKINGDKVVGDKHEHIYPIQSPSIPLLRPTRAANFTNREEELAQLLNALRPGQVVSLCGPGGIGKTALAAESIWQLGNDTSPPERFPDGIFSHNFYTQPETSIALESIAIAFGEEIKPTPAAAAQRALAGKQALLVLDGAENADDLSRVLSARGQCGVLITSRSRTDTVMERYDIRTLAPDKAVELLQAWGKEQAADDAVARRICELVGNLPLAVELAGKYLDTRSESGSDYLKWLEASPLQALDQGEKQHQSVPLLLSRSLEQISPLEQKILSLTGVLAFAPFGLELVALVTTEGKTEQRKAIAQLVNYGLLIKDATGYQLSHALIHTYARKTIEASGETIKTVAGYYERFARQQTELGLPGYRQLTPQRLHILAILDLCITRKYWQAAKDLAWATTDYQHTRGFISEWVLSLKAGLKAAQKLNDRQDEASFIGNLGLAYSDLGQVEQAIDYHQQALVIDREIGYRLGEASDLGNLGNAYRDLGQVEQAIDYHQQALVIHREIGYRQGEASDLGNLGLAYRALGQVEQAIDYHQQALVIHREIGYRLGEASALGNLGNAYRDLGQVEQAIDYHQQALVIDREIGYRLGEASDLGNLGNAYRDLGQVEQAIDYHQQALVIHREIGYRQGEANQLGNLGLAYSDLGQVEQAIDYLKQALPIFEQIKSPNAELTRQWLNDLYQEEE